MVIMMAKPFLEKLDKLIQLHQDVAGLNPALKSLYPIAIVKDEQFLIFDFDQDQGRYRFRKTAPLPMPIPQGVRAAFQLENYGGRIACVVTPEVFDEIRGYVTILHEFVHCYQYETCEQALKLTLDVARQAQEKGNVMWEIEHPFPYTARDFIQPYQGFLHAVHQNDKERILNNRKQLETYLGRHDYEYMVWQEWKEGFARWVENLVKRELGFPENKGGLQPPYSRISFYAGGEAYINYLSEKDPTLVKNIRNLFQRLYAL